MQNLQLDRTDINYLKALVSDRITLCKKAVQDSRQLLLDFALNDRERMTASLLQDHIHIVGARSAEAARLERLQGTLTQLWEEEDALH